jgi:hypothetical protein
LILPDELMNGAKYSRRAPPVHQHFASPTRLTALRDLVAQNMKDRSEWFDRRKKNEKERYKRENRQDAVSCRMAAKERKERKTDSFFVFLPFFCGNSGGHARNRTGRRGRRWGGVRRWRR